MTRSPAATSAIGRRGLLARAAARRCRRGSGKRARCRRSCSIPRRISISANTPGGSSCDVALLTEPDPQPASGRPQVAVEVAGDQAATGALAGRSRPLERGGDLLPAPVRSLADLPGRVAESLQVRPAPRAWRCSGARDGSRRGRASVGPRPSTLRWSDPRVRWSPRRSGRGWRAGGARARSGSSPCSTSSRTIGRAGAVLGVRSHR